MTEPTTETRALLHRALDVLAPIAGESGAVLYSGHDTLVPGLLYVMGLNPGGDPDQLKAEGSVIWKSLVRTRSHWNAYLDENWGTLTTPSPMQARVRDLFVKLNVDSRRTLTTNAVFTRSRTANKLEGLWSNWWNHGWPVHQLFLRAVRPRLILCLGCGDDSPFGLLRTPVPYRGRVPRLWQDDGIASRGAGLVVRRVELDLGQGERHVCAVAALPHPSRFAGAYAEAELRPFLTEIAPIVASAD
jgi:hypothetical protein